MSNLIPATLILIFAGVFAAVSLIGVIRYILSLNRHQRELDRLCNSNRKFYSKQMIDKSDQEHKEFYEKHGIDINRGNKNVCKKR